MMWTGERKDDGSAIQCQWLWKGEARKLTLPDDPHLGLEQNLVFEVDDLALICVYYLQRRVDNLKVVQKSISPRNKRNVASTNRDRVNCAPKAMRLLSTSVRCLSGSASVG